MSDKKMKVCHITSMHTWDDDRIFERACIGLAQLGIDTTLVASPTAMDKKSEEGISYTDGEVKGGVKLYWLKERKGLKKRIFGSWEAMRKAVRLKPDIIHFHDPDMMPWAYIYSFIFPGAMVFDIHENYCSRVQNKKAPSFVKALLSGAIRGSEKAVIRRIAGYITTTDTMKQLYNGVSKPGIAISNVPFLKRLAELPVSDVKEADITIITSGSHSHARNCMQTVEAAPYVLEKFPDVKFKFVGKYQPASFENELRHKAEELGVSHAIILEGMLPWLQNFQRVAKSHIGCVFYADNLNNRVTIPNRLFEYMAMGLTIIGEAFPEVEKVISDAQCGVTVNSSNPQSIADGLCRLLAKPEILIQMGKNGERAVKNKYNFENELLRMVDFYKEILHVK